MRVIRSGHANQAYRSFVKKKKEKKCPDLSIFRVNIRFLREILFGSSQTVFINYNK